MERFQASWVSVCRIFKLANKVGYSNCEISATLCYWFYQCTDEERRRLSELYPDLIEDMKDDMKESDFYSSKIVFD